jgi:hypothetical protein
MITISGQITDVNGDCTSFDKLVVKFYDTDNDPDKSYAILKVTQDGTFYGEIELPGNPDPFSLRANAYVNVKVNLFLAERNGSETLIETKNYSCEDDSTLEIYFDYDEGKYSYAQNLSVTIKGTITAIESNCISFDKLLVKFYDTYNPGSSYYDSAIVDSTGLFSNSTGIVSPTRGITVMLFVVNRDGNETFVESNDYYYEKDILRVDFNYIESLFSYAHPVITITGLVTPAEAPCNSLDKLIIEYYDGYNPTAAAYTTQTVNALGVFAGNINSPSRSGIAKLYVVNVDTSKTLVESNNFYCPDNDETINFNYDESLYSYAGNYSVTVIGTVTAIEPDCISFDKLLVKFYDTYNSGSSHYDSVAVDSTGHFTNSADAVSPTRGITAKLFVVNRDSSETLVKSNDYYYETGTLKVDFNYRESLYSYARNLNVSINGTVTAVEPDCISFDKLRVKFYNTYNSGSSHYDSVAVDSTGHFSNSAGIVSPTRGITAKLVVVNRDGSETLVKSNDYYYETGTLKVDFNYRESLYSYAHPVITITGLVTPAEAPCNSLDKLIVEYYDGYNPTAAVYASQTVNALGVFTGNINAPSRSGIAKLYVVNVDTSKTLVESNSFYCPDNDETINFNYDESLFSYANSNTNNMGINVKGVVKSTTEEYFNCLDTSNLKVRFYQVGFGSVTLIEPDATVNREGAFTYSISSTINAFKAELLLSDNGTWIKVAESAKLCHHDDLNILFEMDESKVGRPVLAKILSRFSTHGVSDAAIAGLSPEQINELACLTCASVKMLQRLKTAHELYNLLKAVTIPTDSIYKDTYNADFTAFKTDKATAIDVLFGLLGFLSTSLGQAFTFSRETFKGYLKHVVDANILDASYDNNTTLLNRLEVCRNVLLFNSLNDGEYYDAKLIHLSGKAGSGNDIIQKNTLLNDVLNGGGLAGIIKGNFDDNDALLKNVIPVRNLGNHLLNFPPFIKQTITVKTTAEINYWDAAAGGPAFWDGVITSADGLPDGYTLPDCKKQIFQNVGSFKPSARAHFLLGSSRKVTDKTKVQGALSDKRSFDIEEHSAAVFFSTDSTAPNYLSPDKREPLIKFQRVIRLSGDTETIVATDVMFQERYTSSFDVVGTGQVIFTDTMRRGGVSGDAAESIWCRASATAQTTGMMVFDWIKYEGDGVFMPKSLNIPGLTLPGGALPANLPNITTLFGSQDTCACSHCQSVYSAAAYLTDMLNWLRKDVVKIVPATSTTAAITYTGLNALETMKNSLGTVYDRRKDIRHLKLNCNNTNTLLPYIDIVNEILAINILRDDTTNYPLTSPSPPYPSTANLAGALKVEYKKLQTTKTTEEIMVQPENRFPISEALLNKRNYPWVLPYDVAFDEALSYSKISGMDYHEVIKSFSSDVDKYDRINWALAYLNINLKEQAILIGSNSTGSTFWGIFWGLDDTAASTPRVIDVLRVAGLTVEQANEIFNTFYINGTTKIKMKPSTNSADDPCDASKYTFDTAFTKANAEKFMKMVRLMRKTQLSPVELDLALKNLPSTAGTLDNDFLKKLAACIEFTKHHSVSFLDVMLCYNVTAYTDQILTTSFSEYYKKLFLNPLLPATTITFFSAATTYASDINTLTDINKQHLTTVFNISVAALDSIITHLALAGTVPLTKTELAQIHRYSLLINVFKINPQDLTSTITLFGAVFTGNIIKKVWDFSIALSRFAQLNCPLGTFKDIVAGTGIYTVVELDAEAEKAWNSIEKAFQEAHKAKPEILFNTSNLPSSANDILYFTNIVLKNLSIQTNLLAGHVNALLTKYNTITTLPANFNWLKDFIADPDAAARISAATGWTTKKVGFMPIYRLLKRMAMLTDLLDMDAGGIGAAITIMNAPTTAPGTPFYWLENDFTALTATRLKEFLWIKEVSVQAAQFNLTQGNNTIVTPTATTIYSGVYTFAASYKAGAASWTASAGSPLLDFYASLGSNTAYKKLPLNEFVQVFLRAKEIAVTNDLVSVMAAFSNIYDTVHAFKATVNEVWNWVWMANTSTTPTTYPTTTATTITTTHSTDIRRAVNNIYPDFNSWSPVIVPIQNDLRSNLRDAYVAYYIGYKGFSDENKLYAYYLLDTQMSPCMKTSRIVSAISSVQLLIHRTLLGLEKEVFMDEQDKQEWEWRKNYRVWEANRKVFLYPENWIDPSIRKNKTALFKEVEDLLQQDDINDRNCELAYAGYLTGLNEVAHLDIRAVYVEDQNANLEAGDGMKYKFNPNETYHVFARNWNPPFTYYYRKFKNGVWSGWENLDIEIDSDHLIPCMFNRKIYLFFPLFVEKTYSTYKDANGKDIEMKYYEIQMSYTKLDFGKWSQKKLLPAKLECGSRAFQLGNPSLYEKCNPGFYPTQENVRIPGNDVFNSHGFWSYASMAKSDFYFWAENKDNGDLFIHCRRALDPDKRKTSDTYTQFAFEPGFNISACDERVSIASSYEINDNNKHWKFLLNRPFITMPYFQQMKWGKAQFGANKPVFGGGDFYMYAHNGNNLALLTDLADYILTYPQQFKHSRSNQPFFFNHKDRSYFFRYKRSVTAFKTIDPTGTGGGVH